MAARKKTVKKQDPSPKKKKTQATFDEKFDSHKKIVKSARGTAFENYSTNKIRKELGNKPKLMKGTKMSKKGSYTPGKGINLK